MCLGGVGPACDFGMPAVMAGIFGCGGRSFKGLVSCGPCGLVAVRFARKDPEYGATLSSRDRKSNRASVPAGPIPQSLPHCWIIAGLLIYCGIAWRRCRSREGEAVGPESVQDIELPAENAGAEAGGVRGSCSGASGRRILPGTGSQGVVARSWGREEGIRR